MKNTQTSYLNAKYLEKAQLEASLSNISNVDTAQDASQNFLGLAKQAKALAEQAQDLLSLLEIINTFDSQLECQNFSYKTSAYQDMQQVDILWIGNVLSADDDRNQRIFSDYPSNMIIELLKTIGIDRTEKNQNSDKNTHTNSCIGFTNLSFWPLSMEASYDKNYAAYHICLPFLRKIIEFIKPKKIIISGDIPLYHLLSIDNSMLAKQKSALKLSIADQEIDCYATFSLDYILKSDVAKKIFWFDLLQFLHNNT